MQGEGIFFYANGNRFEGAFANDKLHGEGTYYYSNVDRYVGPWRENKRQGPGGYFDAEGNAEQMEFRDGMRVS